MYQTTITQDISCGGGNHQIASITITQNNYINLYFQPTIDFNAICNSFSLLTYNTNANEFTNTLISITFTIYKENI